MEYFLPEMVSLLELLIVSCDLDVILNYSACTVTNPQARHIIFYPCDLAKTDLHLGHCFMSNNLLKIHILFITHPISTIILSLHFLFYLRTCALLLDYQLSHFVFSTYCRHFHFLCIFRDLCSQLRDYLFHFIIVE